MSRGAALSLLAVLAPSGCASFDDEIGDEHLSTESFEVKARGTYSDWWLPTEPVYSNGKRGYYNKDIVLFPGNDPGPGQAYFYSHQFGLVDGDGGYIGIQSDANGKRAIFSIWQANAAYGPGIARPFDGEGSGYQTMIPYNWVAGHYYRLRVWTTSTDSAGTWWCGWVKDNTTNVESWIGCIRVPLPWKWLSSWSVTWLEDYGPEHASCATVPYAVIYFDHPTGNNGAARAGEPYNHYGPASTNTCTSRISLYGNWVRHEIGQ